MFDLNESTPQKKVLFLCGSPRARGNTEVLLGVAQEAAQHAGAAVGRFFLSEGEVSPCVECDGCLQTGECIIRDRMDEFFDLADAADVLIVGTPVFWAGPPSQLKALYDRIQPRWARRYVMGEKPLSKRHAYLLVTGTGNDPHGYEPVVTITRSALAPLGFALDAVFDCVGFDQAGTQSERALYEDRARELGKHAASMELT